MNKADAHSHVQSHLEATTLGETVVLMFFDELSNIAKWSQLETKRVDSRVDFFEAEALENLRMFTEVFVNKVFPD